MTILKHAYVDGATGKLRRRFDEDERFAYFIYNWALRKQVASSVNIYSEHEGVRNIEQLAEKIRDNPRAADHLLYHSLKNVTGS